jgi:WD40 repeat protein
LDLQSKKLIHILTVPLIVTGVAWSPDGKMIAATSTDQLVRLWEAETGNMLATFPATNAVRAVAFSPSGTQMIGGIDDHVVMVWSLPQSEVRSITKGNGKANGVTFGGKGKWIGAVIDRQAIVWEAVSGREVNRFSAGTNSRIALSNVTSLVGGATDGALTDYVQDKVAVQFQERRTRTPYGGTPGSAFNGGGNLFAETVVCSTRSIHGVNVWNAQTGHHMYEWPLDNWTTCVVFSPDDKLLAVGSGSMIDLDTRTANSRGGAVGVWNVVTGENLFKIHGLPLGVWGLSFSPDGKRLALAMGNYQNQTASLGRVRLLDVATWQTVGEVRGHLGCVWSVAFNPTGTRMATAAGPYNSSARPIDGEVKIWDTATLQEMYTIRQEKAGMLGVAFSPDGRYLATAASNGEVKLWDGTPLAETPAFAPLPEPHP